MSKQRQRLNSSYRTREGFQQDVLPKVNHECIEVISQAEKGGRKLWTEKTIDALLRTMGYMQETTNNPLFLEKMGFESGDIFLWLQITSSVLPLITKSHPTLGILFHTGRYWLQ